MKKLTDRITIIVFFLFVICSGVLALFFGRGELADMRSVKDGEKLLRESFPMGGNMKALYTLSAKMLGQEKFFDIYYDEENGRLVELFDSYDKKKVANAADAVTQFHSAYPEIPTYIMLVPTASGIYRDKMPPYSGAIDQQKMIERLYRRINADVTPIDVWGAMYQVRDNYIFYRTEDRWNQQGAYAAYSAAVPKLGGSLYSISNYDVEYTHVEFHGSLAEKSGIKKVPYDRINAYRCKFGSYVISCDVYDGDGIDNRTSVYSRSGLQRADKYSFFLGHSDCKYADIKTTADGLKLLVIGSDYGNCFMPFLCPHYSEITFIDPKYFDKDETLSDLTDPSGYDQVLFLYDLKNFCEYDGLDKLK